MVLIMNPGTGNVKGATEENAITNIEQFIDDLGQEGIQYVRVPEMDEGGRFGFRIKKRDDQPCHLIDMPGCDDAKLRWAGPGFPVRLYVDGSSWQWDLALGMCKFGVEE